jgi:hypothetical protein
MMASAWPWVAAAAAVAVVVAASGASGTDDGDEGGGEMVTRKQQLYWRLRQIDALSEEQRMFLMLTAFGEGAYSTAAHNGSAAERAASSKAADKNPTITAWALSCGVPDAALRSGSWSMFQLLAPYYAGTVREIFGAAGCPFADPSKAPGRLDLQIVIGIEHAHDLQGYDGWRAVPTIGNLRLGWANPSFMGKLEAHADRIGKYVRHAQKVVPSWSESEARAFINTRISRFPADTAGIFQALQNTPAPTGDPL